ncbi:MAG: hypothetical protein SNJ77_03870, partial [Cytophagales bacterium]
MNHFNQKIGVFVIFQILSVFCSAQDLCTFKVKSTSSSVSIPFVKIKYDGKSALTDINGEVVLELGGSSELIFVQIGFDSTTFLFRDSDSLRTFEIWLSKSKNDVDLIQDAASEEWLK